MELEESPNEKDPTDDDNIKEEHEKAISFLGALKIPVRKSTEHEFTPKRGFKILP